MNPETILAKNIRMAINRTGRARLVPNVVGVFSAPSGARVRCGLGEGSPDLVGILRNGRGTAFCLEIKTATGAKRKAQIAWWGAAKKSGITGGFARSIDDAFVLLELAELDAREHDLSPGHERCGG